VFTDHASGRDTNRPQFQAMRAHVREGDELVVHSMDRLARSLVDLRRTVDELTAEGVWVRFVKEGLTFGDTNDPCAVPMLSVMGAVAEFERALLQDSNLRPPVKSRVLTPFQLWIHVQLFGHYQPALPESAGWPQWRGQYIVLT
jgi:Resolvase, N terminal domain